ncbi:MAG: PLP-dependent aminotransferase family protein [Candidatus Cloacimonetes bacterium]|nr:PLP-dependent aminotransferase family protein [Candidatus Cloacimonadota bacterium]MCF7814212.1 PLP-dependent aminotransferase family protein [Candidatus Cloacimonadota bacterium]MCF7868129.1 PLP-dependent aminotransferase family protein [Candidatus Cloacimonadota bacterium]MCF7883595.1 PLP-dependent aminotransferase family protein [Candidatus Cloacimonadota bacterium]
MISDLNEVLSLSVKGMKKSAIRELLKLTKDPDIISFAGGLPAPETFPKEVLIDIVKEVIEEDGSHALQYGTTEGDDRLRELIAENYNQEGFNITKDDILITTASQQGLDLLAKVFINRGDKVLVGLPSYLGGLGAFNAYGAQMVGVKFDEHGMCPKKLEEKIIELKKNGEKPKFIYVIPDFQNPAGVTLPESRRKEIIEIAYKYDILIVEDSPYKQIRFEGEDQASLFALDGTGHVINLGTFSKIFVPGFRIGWVIAHRDVLDKFIMAKQSTDLCTSPFVQKIAAKYIEKGYFKENLKKTIQNYKEKKEIMMAAFEKYMPEGVTWTKPEGGLFLFVTLPEYMDTEKLFLKAVEQKVAFVIGSVFHCDGSGKNTMRINFSYVDKEKNLEGVKRLAKVIKAEMK